MSNNFYANVPISLPLDNNFSVDVSAGGFAVDLNQGLFIPLYSPVDMLEPPAPPVYPQN